jgi:hemerythrin
MAAIHWEESMSVGVSILDVDHRRLVEILARLQNSVGEHSNRELIAATIATLLEYTEEHFRHEEESMERFNYPDIAQHVGEHNDLMRKLLAFKDNAERGQTASAIELMDFLGGYLTNHMLGADKKLGLFLRSRLPAEAAVS